MIIGYGALQAGNISQNSVMIGTEAGYSLSSTNTNGTVALGHQSQYRNQTGRYNTGLGYSTLRTNIDGDSNTAVGYASMYNFEAASDGEGDNTAVGTNALNNATTGTHNTAVGSHVARTGTNDLTTGTGNTLIGSYAALSSGSAVNEIVIGSGSIGLGDNQTVIGNSDQTHVVFGGDALISGSAQSTGSFGHLQMDGKDLPPIFITGSSIYLGQGGTGTGDAGAANPAIHGNVGIGYDVLSDIGTGARNVAIGLSAMPNRIAATENVAIGYRAGGPGTSQYKKNTLVGVDAGYSLDGSGGTNQGGQNTFIGHQAGDGATSAESNVAIGDNSGRNLSTGTSNVFVGQYSGNAGNTNYGIYIGNLATATDGASNEIVIGKNAIGKGSNTALIGDDNITDIYMSEDVGAKVHTGDVSGSAISTGSFGRIETPGVISASGTIFASTFNDDGQNLNVPDYVFDGQYKLRTINQLETFVSESKHLPGVPSTNDKQEWSTYSMGDRDMILLEKIEELSLYVIELNKRIEKLESKRNISND